MNPEEDALLFHRIQNGEAAAFEILYDKYNTLVYTFAFRGCGNSELANEITQDVFIRLWTTQASFRPELSQFSTWLLTITRRVCRDKLKKLQFKLLNVSIETMNESGKYDSTEQPELLIQTTWFRKDVFAVLQTLQQEERLIIEMAYFHGFTLREIANRLDIPIGTIKTRLHKGLRTLRSRLPEWEGGLKS